MNSGARVLVVDDERHIRRSLQVSLESRGYAVETAETGEQALTAFTNRLPDIAVVDLVMPGMDGVELTRCLRQRSALPIIVLSAIGEERRKVEVLEIGADDYVTKPFGTEELLARIRALLRRAAGAQSSEPVYKAGGLSVHFDRREVRMDTELIQLTPTEYDLLKYLVEHAGKVVTHRMLLEAVWGPGYVDQTQYLRVFVGHLRKKLEPEPTQPRFIVTDPGVGYRFQPAQD
ncbi:MAG: response regulator transcription factor [Nitrospirales bacterium]|nr:response regulator transcription factor [Nitrospirales bacterium]